MATRPLANPINNKFRRGPMAVRRTDRAGGNMRSLIAVAASLVLVSCASVSTGSEPRFHKIFDGKTLNGWEIKVTHHPLGANPHGMWTAKDGVMKINFDGFEQFKGEYAHVFYKKPLKNYILRLDYRFAGKQAPGGPGWATRNSGVMLFAQPPETMTLDQNYPISLENQLLGGLGKGPRTTLSVCMVEITVKVDGKPLTAHCNPNAGATSQTFDGDQWVKLRVEVVNGVVKSYVNDQLGNTFTEPTVDKPHPWLKSQDATAQPSYFALQGESDQVEFRNIELAELP